MLIALVESAGWHNTFAGYSGVAGRDCAAAEETASPRKSVCGTVEWATHYGHICRYVTRQKYALSRAVVFPDEEPDRTVVE